MSVIVVTAVVVWHTMGANPGPSRVDLPTARQGFVTQLCPNSFTPDGPAPVPPKGLFNLVRYSAPVGRLAAYVTPDPGDGKRHPAVLWAHGGFGGIGSWFWEPATPDNDQTARAFREAGLVLMCPSFRGENDNPGSFELFYGEVDDLLAAREYLARLPYVDSRRIYVAGHSSGGTLTLLAAESTDRFRAAFSFGGAPDVAHVVGNGRGYGNTPYDCRNERESYLRSPTHFVRTIKCPTFYFEGGDSAYVRDALRMNTMAKVAEVPFTAYIVQGADHFSILAPITALVAQRIQQDTGPRCDILITNDDIHRSFGAMR